MAKYSSYCLFIVQFLGLNPTTNQQKVGGKLVEKFISVKYGPVKGRKQGRNENMLEDCLVQIYGAKKASRLRYMYMNICCMFMYVYLQTS